MALITTKNRDNRKTHQLSNHKICGLSIFDNGDDGHPYFFTIFFKIAENELWRTYEAKIEYIVAKKKQFVAISPEILHDKFTFTQLPVLIN